MKSIQTRSSKIAFISLVLIAFMMNVATAQSVYVGKAGPKGKVLRKYIEPSELKKIVDNPVDSIWIIDVRSEKAFANCHIPTARSFPYSTIVDRSNEIPKDKYLILYCTIGASAKIALKNLKKAGYKRTIDWGGISRWEGEKETK
jgi:rhodanese-related sulfurtransferase